MPTGALPPAKPEVRAGGGWWDAPAETPAPPCGARLAAALGRPPGRVVARPPGESDAGNYLALPWGSEPNHSAAKSGLGKQAAPRRRRVGVSRGHRPENEHGLRAAMSQG
jgi:hypothetical protein